MGERRAVYPLPDGGTPILECGGLPLPDGGTPSGLPPAGRGNAECNVAVYPLPDGGTPIWNVAVYPPPPPPPARRGHADLECGGLPPCRTGARRFGLWQCTPVMAMSQPPLPTSSLYYYKVENMQGDDQDECSNRRMQLRLREREREREQQQGAVEEERERERETQQGAAERESEREREREREKRQERCNSVCVFASERERERGKRWSKTGETRRECKDH